MVSHTHTHTHLSCQVRQHLWSGPGSHLLQCLVHWAALAAILELVGVSGFLTFSVEVNSRVSVAEMSFQVAWQRLVSLVRCGRLGLAVEVLDFGLTRVASIDAHQLPCLAGKKHLLENFAHFPPGEPGAGHTCRSRTDHYAKQSSPQPVLFDLKSKRNVLSFEVSWLMQIRKCAYLQEKHRRQNVWKVLPSVVTTSPSTGFPQPAHFVLNSRR